MPYSTLNRRRTAFLAFAWMGLLMLSDAAAHGDDLIPKLGLGMHQGTDLVPTPTPLRGSPGGPSAGEPKGGEGEVDLGPSDADTDIKYHGTPTPGARVSLGLSGSNTPGMTYYWRQVEGPRVAIDDPTKPHVSFTIPQGARRLRFLLEMRGPRGERSLRVVIPIAATSSQDRSSPVADAGDDQIGLSGRTITLSGARSTPASRIKSYRWIQIAGPKVMDTSQEKHFFSFTPPAPGVYRFLLLVAADDVVSEPDEVVVMVGELPDSRGASPGNGSMIALGRPMPWDAGIQGRMLTEQVAEVFKAISDRVALYPSFDYLASEMSRNLDAIIPRDPQSRLIWSQGIFIPLSRTLELEMLAVGLDLRWPEAHQRTLTEKQKVRLQRVFLTFAQEFRSGSSAR